MSRPSPSLRAAGCRTLSLDVTDERSRQAAVDTVVAEHGAVGALVNNAGYSQSGALETLDLDEVRRQFETNVFGLLRMCQLVPARRCAQRGAGRIVNVSSMGANFTFPGGGSYHATKYAVEALSDALRFEVAGFGVGVTVIQPGLIRTSFSERAVAEVPPPDRAVRAVRRVQPQRRRIHPVGVRARPAGPAGRRAARPSPRRSPGP